MRISEIFYSIQGEGILVGVPSVFIRTAGCNLDCHWCDTAYAIKPGSGEEWPLEGVIERVASWPCARHVVITGGEPLMAPQLGELTRLLRARGKHITIETNTTIAPPGGVVCDLASLSPKLRHAGPRTPPIDPGVVRAWIERSADYQLKIVARGSEDLPEISQLAESLSGIVPPDRIMLMPLTTQDPSENLKRRDDIVRICLENGFRYATRLHLELFDGRRGF